MTVKKHVLWLICLAFGTRADTLKDDLFAAIQQQHIDTELIDRALHSPYDEDAQLAFRVLGNVGGKDSRLPLFTLLQHERPEFRARAAAMIAMARLPNVEAELLQAWQSDADESVRNALMKALAERGGDETQQLILQHMQAAEKMVDPQEKEAALQRGAEAASILWRSRQKQLTVIDVQLATRLLQLSETKYRYAYFASLALVAVRQHTDLFSTFELEQAFKRALNVRAKEMLMRCLAVRINQRATQALIMPIALDPNRPSRPVQWQALQAYTNYLPLRDAQQFVRDNSGLLDDNAVTHLLLPWFGRGQNLLPVTEDLQQLTTAQPECRFLFDSLLDEISQGVIGVEQKRVTFRKLAINRLSCCSRYRVETDRQVFIIKLNWHETPYAADYFSQLVEQGFYEQLRFHHVIPGMFAQTGVLSSDPIAKNGLTWPAELSTIPIRAGTVAFVGAGQRLNGSQLFIAQAELPHIDRRFTSFADVEQYSKVLPIVPGEKIRSIRVAKREERDLLPHEFKQKSKP